MVESESLYIPEYTMATNHTLSEEDGDICF